MKKHQVITVQEVGQDSKYLFRGTRYLVRGLGKRAILVSVDDLMNCKTVDAEVWEETPEQVAEVAQYAYERKWKKIVIFHSLDRDCLLVSKPNNMMSKGGFDNGSYYVPTPVPRDGTEDFEASSYNDRGDYYSDYSYT
jgi:hypothetical protein